MIGKSSDPRLLGLYTNVKNVVLIMSVMMVIKMETCGFVMEKKLLVVTKFWLIVMKHTIKLNFQKRGTNQLPAASPIPSCAVATTDARGRKRRSDRKRRKSPPPRTTTPPARQGPQTKFTRRATEDGIVRAHSNRVTRSSLQIAGPTTPTEPPPPSTTSIKTEGDAASI